MPKDTITKKVAKSSAKTVKYAKKSQNTDKAVVKKPRKSLKGTKRPKWDRETAKIEYMTTNMTMLEIAKKYGVTERTIQLESAKKGWVQLRGKFVKDIQSEHTIARQADVGEHYRKQMDDAEKIRAIGVNTLTRLWAKVKNDNTAVPDIVKIRQAASVIAQAHEMSRTAMGLPNNYTGSADRDGNPVDPQAGAGDTFNTLTFIDFVNKVVDKRGDVMEGEVSDAQSS